VNPVLKATLATLAAAAVLAALWFGGWWLREESVNRSSEINNDSYARQTALVEEVIDLHTQIADLDVKAAGDVTDEQKTLILTQRAALVTNLCSAYDQTTDTVTIPSDIHAFAAQEC
jgi:hypothetical protein